MLRLFVPLTIALTLTAGLLLWLSPKPIQATQPPPPGPGYLLNSEGDEWILITSDQVDPIPPAPAAIQQYENEDSPLEIPAAALPGPEVELGMALDRARNAGPEAVLAFVASQPNPHQSLLEAAVSDAQNELSSHTQSPPSAPDVPRVSLNSGPCFYETIQEAINAAVNGDTVRVAAGVFAESIDVSGKNIVIQGGYNPDCATLPLAPPQSQLQATVAGSVVDVSSSSVLTLRNLDLSGGTSFGAGVDVLGSSQVTLDNTNVHNNAGASGGGLYVGSGSVLTYMNSSSIYNNTGSAGGGAIVYGRLYGYGTFSDIRQNSSTTDGGGIYAAGGTVLLDNADIVANTATNRGGGIYVASGGVITLTNSVFVGETSPCCQSAATGGGIYASASHIFLLGSANVIMNNTATTNGGGLYLINGSTLDATGGSVGYDTQSGAGNDAVLGAGMYVITSTVDFSGRIINNIASNSGGGLYATNSTITMTNATVGGVGANQHNQIGATGLNGAGMYLINNTHASLDNTRIVSNTLSNPGTGYGGGIYIRQGSAITVTNSRIEQHFLPSIGDGRGAGMYIYDSTVSLNNTQVISNTASGFAGGARLFGTSRLNILSGTSFTNNEALNGSGGAIAATNAPDINATNASFKFNSASGNGGAIYLDAGTLDFTGNWDVRYNTASGNGGAVAVAGSGDADFTVSAGPASSYLSNNHAGGNGGALYVTNADSVSLYATSGFPLELNTNTAGGNGGAAFANGGAFFDVYGNVQATSNAATGNGGAFYLSNASRIWMDDYFNVIPQIWVNTAANGGAIYASDSPRVECDGAEFGTSSNGNRATSGSGGAIYLSGSTLTADNCTFRNSQAQAGNGGAIAAITSTLTIDTDYPAALTAQGPILDRSNPDAPLATACDPTLRQCSSLYLNTSTGNGGAIFSNGSNLTVGNTYLHRNTAQRGGAIYQEGVSAVGNIANTLVYSNTSTLAFGAGVRVAGGSMTVNQSTLANNTGGAGYSPGSAQSYISNTIIWGNSVAAFGALTTAVCNIDQGGTAGPATNPLFFSPGGGENYRLRLGSPAIDACATGLPRDILNVPRPVGALFDMGAYEMHYRFIYLPAVLR